VHYDVERTIAQPIAVVWEALADLQHFARNDPFHHDLVFLSDQYAGPGTCFAVRHTYLPIFPFPPDDVLCTVTVCEPEQRIDLNECNTNPYKSHRQRFDLERLDARRTRVRYRIAYAGVPRILPAWRVWAAWRVKARMRDKLTGLESDCRAVGL
jgi:hypothetical protein